MKFEVFVPVRMYVPIEKVVNVLEERGAPSSGHIRANDILARGVITKKNNLKLFYS